MLSNITSLLGLSAPSDPTYGRASLPLHPVEQEMRNAPYTCTDTRLPSSSHTIYVQTWSLASPTAKPVADLINVHGLGDYGGRMNKPWANSLVNEGFRLTSLDLPGHGRSSGLHGYFSSIDEHVQALRTVVKEHVAKLPKTTSGKLFIMCGSLGGLVGITYSIQYGKHSQYPLDGIVILCPLIIPMGASRPSYALQVAAQVIRWIPGGGTLAVAEANRGKNSQDPNNEKIFMADPLAYSGPLRVGSGLAMLEGFETLQENLNRMEVPFITMHGDADLVTSPEGSKMLYEHAPVKDKTLKVWEGQWHDLTREPKTLEVLAEAVNWLKARC
ncbi:hypothetical protein HDV00_005356 [Rhizophlyctis rosea]|nr:hypothetical protein HDV00_005356 [Rhizophlyctis rosea]